MHPIHILHASDDSLQWGSSHILTGTVGLHAWACYVGLPCGHATCSWYMECMLCGHALWSCSIWSCYMVVLYGHAIWTCLIGDLTSVPQGQRTTLVNPIRAKAVNQPCLGIHPLPSSIQPAAYHMQVPFIAADHGELRDRILNQKCVRMQRYPACRLPTSECYDMRLTHVWRASDMHVVCVHLTCI